MGIKSGICILICISILMFSIAILVIAINNLKKASSIWNKSEMLEEQNLYYTEQMNRVQKEYEQTKRTHHDMKNHILAIQSYLENNNYEQAEIYLHKIISISTVMEYYVNTGNTLMDAIINYKLNEAKEIGAEIDIDINCNLVMQIDSFDLTVILGNLFDNALRALKECVVDKKISVYIRQEKGYITMRIINTYSGEIWIKKGIFISKKPDGFNHGIGISNVQRVVKKNGGVLRIKYDNNIFQADTILYLEG